MRLGALNNLIALLVIAFADDRAAVIRLSAQVQFIHGMATLACATFMNIGARDARLSPAFFLGGILLYCIPTYAVAAGAPAALLLIKPFGLGTLTVGWLILAWSAREIDRG